MLCLESNTPDVRVPHVLRTTYPPMCIRVFYTPWLTPWPLQLARPQSRLSVPLREIKKTDMIVGEKPRRIQLE